MERIKVLQINKLYYPTTGGIEKTVQQLSEGLSKTTRISVLVCSEKNRTQKEVINGVSVTRAASLGVIASMPISFRFISLFKKMSKNQDIIHIHMPFPLADLAYILSGYEGKVIVWYHSDIVRQESVMKLYEPIMLSLLKRSDAIVVATKGHIYGSKYLKRFEKKCVVIPFGVNESIAAEAKKYISSKKYNQGKLDLNKKVKFLFVGRLVYYKGCEELIEAFKYIQNAELIIVGDGPLKERLEKKVIKYGIHNKVKFYGIINNSSLIRAYKACDALVLPSLYRSEAFGLVQIEAMCFGKPIINTKLASGVPFVSEHKQTGLTVSPGNIKELFYALQWMVEHKEERENMGRAARRKAEREYTEERMLERVLLLYQQLTMKGL